jgi:hypothetical protein
LDHDRTAVVRSRIVPQLGWYPDPMQHHERRFFDGVRWTEHVADGDVRAVDPFAETMLRPEQPRPIVMDEGRAPRARRDGGPRPVQASTMPTVAGWYIDPSRHHSLRYYDGQVWTEYVADDDGYRVDPI